MENDAEDGGRGAREVREAAPAAGGRLQGAHERGRHRGDAGGLEVGAQGGFRAPVFHEISLIFQGFSSIFHGF